MNYLGLVKQIETRQAEYRAALRRWWASSDDREAYQQLLCLLDDLGVAEAHRIMQDELSRWQEAK